MGRPAKLVLTSSSDQEEPLCPMETPCFKSTCQHRKGKWQIHVWK